MQQRDFSKVPLVRNPIPEAGKPLMKFMRYIGEKYSRQIDNYWDLHQWSTENLSQFWGELWDMADFIHSKPYEKVMDLNLEFPYLTEWFPGARINFAENALRYRDERIAIIATGEERNTRKITYAEVYTEVSRYGAALRKIGIKKNDHVVCHMPSREEPLFGMLGAASIGAIWSAAVPLYGTKAVVRRFKQTKPKILFTIDRFTHNGENVEMLEKIKEIADNVPSLEKVVIIPWQESSLLKDISDIRNSCFLEEFLSMAENLDGTIPELEFEQLPFNHPIVINYTSGTTGQPKAIIHGFGGFLAMTRNFWLHDHETRDETWLSTSPAGLFSWTRTVSFLMFGYTVVVYEGVPFLKYPTSLWDLVDEFGITGLHLQPNVLDNMERMKCLPGKRNSLSSLKVIKATGSVVKQKNYDFVLKQFKNIVFKPTYGLTEFFGSCMECDLTLPIYRGEIASSILGMDVSCYDDFGKPVIGEMGEIVIRNIAPCIPIGLLGDDDGSAYKERYFSKFPGVFTTGDFAIINPISKGFVICGRSDDTLNPKGNRFGSSEIYNIVNLFPEVLNCLCVSQYNMAGDERVVLFLKMDTNYKFTDDFTQRIQNAIAKGLAEVCVPEVILEVPDVPMNLNGKKMESTVKKIINRLPYNADEVENYECLKHFENIPELQGY